MITEGGHEVQGGFAEELFEVCSHANKNYPVTREILMMQDRGLRKKSLKKLKEDEILG